MHSALMYDLLIRFLQFNLMHLNISVHRMKTKCLLTRIPEYNHWHNTWSFTFAVNPTGRNVQHLDKMDLDFVDGRDQIKIWCRSVRAYIQQQTDIVSVFMELPPQVDKIIIFRFGEQEPVCYAVNQGHDVYPGSLLDRNPFSFYEELKRLRIARHRRKLVF